MQALVVRLMLLIQNQIVVYPIINVRHIIKSETYNSIVQLNY